MAGKPAEFIRQVRLVAVEARIHVRAVGLVLPRIEDEKVRGPIVERGVELPARDGHVTEEFARERSAQLMVATGEHERLRVAEPAADRVEPLGEQLVFRVHPVERIAVVHQEVRRLPVDGLHEGVDPRDILVRVGHDA